MAINDFLFTQGLPKSNFRREAQAMLLVIFHLPDPLSALRRAKKRLDSLKANNGKYIFKIITSESKVVSCHFTAIKSTANSKHVVCS